jgi:uncharacterized protein YdaU (DUF1376 family)
MSLPWFAFDIAAYVKDTMRLATEGHGAYLLLMLDYYANETPPPDDDDVLASIAKLPVEVWKAKHRKVLAPFFRIEGGFWHHDRIEAEILDGHTKLALGIAKGQAGAAARWGKKPPRNAPSKPQALPVATPEHSPSNALLPSPINSLSTDRDAIEESEAAIGTPIDPKFWPDPNHIAVCKIDGATDEIIQAEVTAFVANKRESGAFSNDWDASWTMWWKRWKEHRAKVAKAAKPRAAPRVEVSGRVEITEAQWDTQCALFAKDGASLWSFKHYGPEPGMSGCRCPPEILTRHGINPTTGIVAPKAWRPAPAKEPV